MTNSSTSSILYSRLSTLTLGKSRSHPDFPTFPPTPASIPAGVVRMQQFSLLPREKSTFPCILQEFFREFPLSPATPGPAKVPPVFSSAFQDGVPDYLLRVVLETVTAEASGPDIPAHQANHLLFGLLPDLYQELRQHVHLFGEHSPIEIRRESLPGCLVQERSHRQVHPFQDLPKRP